MSNEEGNSARTPLLVNDCPSCVEADDHHGRSPTNETCDIATIQEEDRVHDHATT